MFVRIRFRLVNIFEFLYSFHSASIYKKSHCSNENWIHHKYRCLQLLNAEFNNQFSSALLNIKYVGVLAISSFNFAVICFSKTLTIQLSVAIISTVLCLASNLSFLFSFAYAVQKLSKAYSEAYPARFRGISSRWYKRLPVLKIKVGIGSYVNRSTPISVLGNICYLTSKLIIMYHKHI